MQRISISSTIIINLTLLDTLREVSETHHNYNTSTFFSSNENLAFLVMKTLNLLGTAFQEYKVVTRTIKI